MQFSKDPALRLSEFVKLISLANTDVEKANQEIANRMSGYATSDGDTDAGEYIAEKQNIQTCKDIIAEVKKSVNG